MSEITVTRLVLLDAVVSSLEKNRVQHTVLSSVPGLVWRETLRD